MIIQEIPYASALYEASTHFREEVLRRPLGLTLSAQDVDGEDSQIHIAAVEGGTIIVGTVLLKPLPSGHVKLRQMAVSGALQGQGVGRKLVRFAETAARARGARIIEMHARVSAREFYEKLGYRAVGEKFIEVTVPTVRMIKTLL